MKWALDNPARYLHERAELDRKRPANTYCLGVSG